ncbi:MAG: N-acetylglucosamine-6-phosphate deacetylase [Roseiarcus sp.]|jgi:N-acetylglucosamine-6-phosphate deacetylase
MSGASGRQVFYGARLFDGEALREDCALVVEDGVAQGIVPVAERPRGGAQHDLGGGVLAPGFIDWQVNGGGGVLFNATPTPEAIGAIAAAHRHEGTTAILPTVITDAPEVLATALTAAREAVKSAPGAFGVHVEGPYIDARRKGVHSPEFMRKMREKDADRLIAAQAGAMVVTVAPVAVGLDLIAKLAAAGLIVSLGHAEASAEEAKAAFAAGASAVTHLFNAMTQLSSRAPGLVGAALADPHVFCGLIADGHHVHDTAMRAAFNAKGAGAITLVSDAMPPAAGGPPVFALQGRRMTRTGGRLIDEDGTLAGAAITMLDAVRYVARTLGLPLADALRMATSTPARLLRLDDRIGRLAPGLRADLVHLSDDLGLAGVWMGGRREHEIER